MPHISELKESNYLTKNDCGAGILLTIKELKQENLAMQGQPEELKWCLYFVEQPKAMVLNTTNAQIIAQITGSEQTEQWTGKKIVLYNDPSISFQGRLVGGIRARAPRGQAAAKPAPAPAPALAETAGDDDVPF